MGETIKVEKETKQILGAKKQHSHFSDAPVPVKDGHWYCAHVVALRLTRGVVHCSVCPRFVVQETTTWIVPVPGS